MIKVYIDGSAGTTGLRINERLATRSDIELMTLPEEKRKDPVARKVALNSCDVAFLCLPDQAAIEAVAMIDNPNVKVIDASTAHRTNPNWAYGFAELSQKHHAAIALGKRVAVPGCHASGFCALVYPLVFAGLMAYDFPVICHSVTGYSGGGKSMIAEYTDVNRNTQYASPRQYGLAQSHKHIPEMVKVCGLTYAPVFNPIVADFYSGMLVTINIFTRMLNSVGTIPAQVQELYEMHYANQDLIQVMPLNDNEENGFLCANALSGKDNMQIFVNGNDERITVSARFDNLGKGASGAAISCMNIMFGLDESVGLVL